MHDSMHASYSERTKYYRRMRAALMRCTCICKNIMHMHCHAINAYRFKFEGNASARIRLAKHSDKQKEAGCDPFCFSVYCVIAK